MRPTHSTPRSFCSGKLSEAPSPSLPLFKIEHISLSQLCPFRILFLLLIPQTCNVQVYITYCCCSSLLLFHSLELSSERHNRASGTFLEFAFLIYFLISRFSLGMTGILCSLQGFQESRKTFILHIY